MDWGKIKGGGLLGHRKYGIFVSPDSNLLPMPTPKLVFAQPSTSKVYSVALTSISPPPCSGWVVTNPPYGVRLRKTNDLRNLYAQLGKVLRTKCSGWHVTMLCGSTQLICSTGLEFDKGISMMNGGLKVRLVRGKVRGFFN